jgi:hypothetical protein
MARSRPRDDDDDYDDDRNDRGRRGRDDDYDDDDYDDRPRSRSGEKGPLDNMYANTNIVVLILFGCCCGLIAFVLSLVAFLTAKDPKAKSNAMIVMIVGGVVMILNIVAAVTGQLAQLGGGR